MADVKWIKITTDMFDNRKIKHLRRLPDGNNIVLIWVMLLTMAGRCNAGGMIFLTENIAYTPKMLADELDFEENTVILALKALEQLNMIVMDGDFFQVAGWEEYQNVDGLEKIREQTKKRVAAHRERKKQETLQATDDVTLHVTHGNALEQEEDLDIKIEDIDTTTVSHDTVRCTDVQRIVENWNALGVGQLRDIKTGTQRHSMLKRRIKEYGLDAILEAIAQVKKSPFLMGGGKNGWVITFDWFIRPNNFPKVYEGNYSDQRRAINMTGGTGSNEAQNDLDDLF